MRPLIEFKNSFDPNDKPLNEKLLFLGYESTNFLLNMGNQFFFFIASIAITLFAKLLSIIEFKKGTRKKRFAKYLKKKVLYSLLLRLLIKSYIEILFVAFIDSQREKVIKFVGESISNIFSAVFMYSMCILTFFIYRFMTVNRKNLSEKNFERKFGVFYSDLDPHSNNFIFYTAFFCLKRLVIF